MMTAHTADIQLEQDKVIDEFSHFEDWSDRYEYLIDLGKALPPLDAQYHTDLHLVKGCQSKVWLHAELKDGLLLLAADSDTIITKGIVALLIRVLSGHPPDEVERIELTFIDEIGLSSHLSPTRSNGLTSMIRLIRSYAKRFAEEMKLELNPPTSDTKEDKLEAIKNKIKEVYDPEIPVDIWELGLIYTLDIDEKGKVFVTMTLTSPACPVAGSLPLEVQERLLQLPFVTDVELALVWDPSWNKERMSDEARMALDMF